MPSSSLRDPAMTLQTFLDRTAPASAATLRRAMTRALLVERPTSAKSYARFYRRVLSDLEGRATRPAA